MADTKPEQSVKVTILGSEYAIKGADPDYIIRIARYVDGEMREITDQQTIASNTRVAILAAMDITDELFQERQRRQKLLLDVESKAAKMVNLVEKYMPFAKEG